MVIFNLRTKVITENHKYHLTQNWDNANSLDVSILSYNIFGQSEMFTTGHGYDWDEHNKGKSIYQKH